MQLHDPWALALLLLVPLLVWLQQRTRREAAVRYPSITLLRAIPHLGARRWRWVVYALRAVVLVLLVAALARPQRGKAESQFSGEGIDIMLAVDISGSMLAEDFTLEGQRANRLEVIKSVVQQFVERRGGDRIGLVLFSGRSYTQCPLTFDHGWLLQNLGRTEIGMIEDGTAIGSALATATGRLEQAGAKSKVIILLTDGQNNAGKISPATAADAAKTLGVKVYTIGAGTRGLAPFPARDLFGNKVYQPMKVDIDEDTLKQIALKTGGAYFRATDTASLQQIYDQIDKMERSTFTAPRYLDYDELYTWLTVPALLLLAVEVGLNHTLLREAAVIDWRLPQVLWLWLLVPAGVGFFVWALRRRRLALQQVAEARLLPLLAPDLDERRQRWRAAMLVVVLAALVTALAGPKWGFHWEEIHREGIDIVIALDTSRSMLADDTKPNRLERAKLAVQDLVKQLQGDRIGLVAFAGSAFVQCPLTLDYAAFGESLRAVDVGIIPKGGTALAEAITTAIGAFEGHESKYEALILITDGEDHAGKIDDAAKVAAEKGIKIYTVGIGTPEGELIRTTVNGHAGFLKDRSGNVVKSRLDDSMLKKIATTTGGAYLHAQGADLGLDVLYRDYIGTMEKRDLKSAWERRFEDRFQLPLLIALALLALEPFVGARRRRVPTARGLWARWGKAA